MASEGEGAALLVGGEGLDAALDKAEENNQEAERQRMQRIAVHTPNRSTVTCDLSTATASFLACRRNGDKKESLIRRASRGQSKE